MDGLLKFALGVTAVLAVTMTGNVAKADDAVATGEKLFKKYCTACHAQPSEDKNRVGPSLHGVVGRHSGQAPGYSYSAANINSGITWTEDKLDPYLANPRGVVPGTKMGFGGIKDPAERTAVIAFLKAN